MSNRLPAKPCDAEAVGAGAGALIARDYASFEALPGLYEALFAQAGTLDPCLTRAWFESSVRHLMAPAERLLLIGAEGADGSASPAALLVGREREHDPLAYGGRSFTSLDSVYSLLYAPLIDHRQEAAAALAPICARICASSSRQRSSYDIVRLQPLDPESPVFAALRRDLRANGFAVQGYRQFGNPFEPSRGLSFADYLARRPSRLRNTIRRSERSLARRGRVEFVIENGGPELGTRLAEYQRVYAESWKATEPNATFIAEFVTMLAAVGALRLGLLTLDGAPVAAQIWVLWHGRAILYKLAHDRRLDRHSPGSVLTARMIAQMLDVEAAGELDFGPGDDAYKSSWAARRRERWGLLAFNPATLRGRLGIVRHIWGRAVKRALFAGANRLPGDN